MITISRIVATGGLACGLLLLATAPAAHAQDGAGEAPAPAIGQLRVFLDCWECDFDFVRTEIDWVDWMRDRADAQVHVLVRSQTTGGGGRDFQMEFIGLRDFAGKVDTLQYVAGRDATSDERRRGLAQRLKVGLTRYAATTPAGARLEVRLPPAPAGTPAAAAPAARDPWNHWTFSVGGSTTFDGESSRSFHSVSANLRASRITHAWKIDLRSNGRYSEQNFTFFSPSTLEEETVLSITRSAGANALVVRSLTGQISLGGRTSLTTSTFGNIRHSFHIAPAIEYNVFPYAESTRRLLTLQYGLGVRSQEYREETIFLRTEETRPAHALNVAFSARQPWGDANFTVEGSQYLHDTGLYNVVFFGGSSVNLVRGLRLNFFGNYALIRDQLSLPRRDATPEEVLLRQRQVKTAYRYWGNIGLSYRFGSAVQNIVNPRFAGGENVMVFF